MNIVDMIYNNENMTSINSCCPFYNLRRGVPVKQRSLHMRRTPVLFTFLHSGTLQWMMMMLILYKLKKKVIVYNTTFLRM